MVDCEGKNFYPTNAIWMTDGYGDYSRHYLRAMAAASEIAPDNSDHLLRTSSIVSQISYEPSKISYNVFDNSSAELLRLTSKPKKVTVDGSDLKETSQAGSEGWHWQTLQKGGVLQINQSAGNKIEIVK